MTQWRRIYQQIGNHNKKNYTKGRKKKKEEEKKQSLNDLWDTVKESFICY